MSESSRRTTLPDQISVSWHIDDVATIRKDLSKRQCREVLNHADRHHDASIGINWDVLTSIADALYPEM